LSNSILKLILLLSLSLDRSDLLKDLQALADQVDTMSLRTPPTTAAPPSAPSQPQACSQPQSAAAPVFLQEACEELDRLLQQQQQQQQARRSTRGRFPGVNWRSRQKEFNVRLEKEEERKPVALPDVQSSVRETRALIVRKRGGISRKPLHHMTGWQRQRELRRKHARRLSHACRQEARQQRRERQASLRWSSSRAGKTCIPPPSHNLPLPPASSSPLTFSDDDGVSDEALLEAERSMYKVNI